MLALMEFIKKEGKNKTIILIPKNKYTEFVEMKLNQMQFKNYKIFKYSSDPRILTGEIEKITNYTKRKNNLEKRRKVSNKFEAIERDHDLRRWKKIKSRYNRGK